MTAEVKTGIGRDIDPILRDGYEVHQAVLRRGMNVTLLPRQVMIVTPPGGDATELAFVHGVPSTSTLSAVTFAQDKRMRRARLVAAGLPVPKGGSYSISNGVADGKRLINKIGYPVVIKPAMGDNMIEVHAGLESEAQVDEAIDYLRTLPNERPTYTKAAYALTLLGEPEEVDGKVVVPRGYRFLVEKQLSGQYLRFLVVADRVLSVLHLPKGLAANPDAPNTDVTHQVHPSLVEMASRAARAVAGLAVAAVDIVVAELARAVDAQDVWIVELSERPWLHAQAAISPDLSRDLGEAILAAHAAELAVKLDDPADEATVNVHMEGLTMAEAAVSAIRAAAAAIGIEAGLEVTDPVEGIADGVLQGSPATIAWIAEMLLDGKLDGHRAMLIEERHDRAASARGTAEAGR